MADDISNVSDSGTIGRRQLLSREAQHVKVVRQKGIDKVKSENEFNFKHVPYLDYTSAQLLQPSTKEKTLSLNPSSQI
jgi:hypothetical protein